MPDHSGRITVGSLISIAQKAGWDSSQWKKRANQTTKRHSAIPHSAAASDSNLAPPVPPQAPNSPSADKMLLTAEEIQALPATPYRVRSVFPARGLASVYGSSGSGKSFLALDMAHAIAAGREDWFGFPVEKGGVAYVALEGQEGIAKRTQAMELHHNETCPETLLFCRGGLQLLDGIGIDKLSSEILRQLGPKATVIVDTLNQAAPNADENGSQDMGKIIGNAKQLAENVDGLVIIVHHAGKDRSRGLRGHSSLMAALDAVIEVRKPEAGREWRLIKSKDDVADQTFGFELLPYKVGSDGYGDITSCAIQRAIHQNPPARKRPSGRHQIKAFEVIRDALLVESSSLTFKDAIELASPSLDCSPDKQRERCKSAIDGLIQRGTLTMHEGAICLS